jgi:hypothetical protein
MSKVIVVKEERCSCCKSKVTGHIAKTISGQLCFYCFFNESKNIFEENLALRDEVSRLKSLLEKQTKRLT